MCRRDDGDDKATLAAERRGQWQQRAAVEDFNRPDRIVLGVADDLGGQQALGTMRQLYAPFNRNHERTRVMDVIPDRVHSAEIGGVGKPDLN